MAVRDRRTSKSEGGFSLVETVAALGILALAAVPLMQLSSDALRNSGRLEARLLARTTAENVLSRAMADRQPIEIGQTSGAEEQLGRRFTWTLSVVPAGQDGLFRLEVRVQQAETEQDLARLITLKAQHQ